MVAKAINCYSFTYLDLLHYTLCPATRYDVFLEVLFWLIFSLWTYSWLDVKFNGKKYIDRKEWKATDPTLLSEGLFSIGTVVAFCKLFYFFQTGHSLGPLIVSILGINYMVQIIRVFLLQCLNVCCVAVMLSLYLQVSFSKMFNDILDFMQIYLCVLLSFSLGMARLYYYYKGQVKHTDGDTKAQSSIFLG